MAKRTTYHVVQNKQQHRWEVKREGNPQPVSTHRTQAAATDLAKTFAKAEPLGQVKIHARGGKIRTEHTYGSDPFPPRG